MSQNNEPAFPGEISQNTTISRQWSGMTLRDYFAAKAMEVFAVDYSYEKTAESAYMQADAMMRERAKHDET